MRVGQDGDKRVEVCLARWMSGKMNGGFGGKRVSEWVDGKVDWWRGTKVRGELVGKVGG